AEGDDLEARRERSEMVTCRRVGAEADDAKGAAVKIIGADDDFSLPVRHSLHLIAPFAHRLDRTLHRFGTAVHRQHLVGAGQRRDLFVEEGQLVVVKGARRQRQPARLLHHCGQDLWMAVALIHRGIGGEAIEVAMSLRIPNKDALAARQNDAERLVVPGAKARFPRDEISNRWIHVSSLQLEPTGKKWAIAIFQPANARLSSSSYHRHFA